MFLRGLCGQAKVRSRLHRYCMFTFLWAATQRDLERLEEQANSNLMTFPKDKCKSDSTPALYRLGSHWEGATLSEGKW